MGRVTVVAIGPSARGEQCHTALIQDEKEEKKSKQRKLTQMFREVAGSDGIIVVLLSCSSK
jgi:hypothetical protein